jgi:RNA polymerase-binding transcription factor DksA
LEAEAPQTTHRGLAAATAAADRDDGLLFGQLFEARGQLRQRDVLSPVDVPSGPLVVLADVEKMEVGPPLAELVNLHKDNSAGAEVDVDPSKARQRLETLRDEFQTTVEEVRTRLAQPQRESGGDVAIIDQHPADVATETAERELDLSRVAMFEARLKQIEDALRRVENGTYGSCVICNTMIPDERLAAVPDTPFCVNDAKKEQSRAQ